VDIGLWVEGEGGGELASRMIMGWEGGDGVDCGGYGGRERRPHHTCDTSVACYLIIAMSERCR
jgi:hypothetical protein